MKRNNNKEDKFTTNQNYTSIKARVPIGAYHQTVPASPKYKTISKPSFQREYTPDRDEYGQNFSADQSSYYSSTDATIDTTNESNILLEDSQTSINSTEELKRDIYRKTVETTKFARTITAQVDEKNRLRRGESVFKSQRKTSITQISSSNGLSNELLLFLFIGLLAVIGGIFYLWQQQEQPSSKLLNSSRKICDFESFSTEFPQQHTLLWKSLKVGIENVLNKKPTSPSIFLFAYKDENRAIQLTKRLVDSTANCMESKSQPLVLSSLDFQSIAMKEDYGVVIDLYKPKLIKSGVLLVSDLNEIPATVAQAFHYFCDTINPLVDRAVIYLTMKIGNDTSQRGLLRDVENKLNENWSDLNKNNLAALIARITDQVYLLE